VREESLLQDIVNTITEIGRCFAIEKNMEKVKKYKSKSNQ